MAAATTKKDKMTALTTIANPLSPSHKKVMIFTNDSNNTLSLENRTIGGDFTAVLGSSDEDSPGPRLAYPSQLTSMMYKEAVNVYGIIGEDKADLKAALLSPTYMPVIDVKPVTGALAGCSTFSLDKAEETMEEVTGYLYMVAAEGAANKIYEYTLSTSQNNNEPVKTAAFAPNTNLFAFYDPVTEHRWLVYQQTDGTISLINISAGTESPITESKNSARMGTPLTAIVVQEDKAKNRAARIYIYFVNNDGNLQFANSAVGKTLYFDSPAQKASTVQPATKVSSTSQLSAFHDLKKSRNIIYGVKSGTSISPTYQAWITS